MADTDSTYDTTRKVALAADDLQFIVVGQKLANCRPLENALKSFSVPIIYSNTGFEYMKKTDVNTVFVVENFEGSIFHQLYKEGCRIVAPPVILRSAEEREVIPYRQRPLYCASMDKLVLCFSGFKEKEKYSLMADLVHHMGGGIRRGVSAKVTHLVAMRTGGEKYRAAVSLGIQIMSEEWVLKCWESRDDIKVHATDEDLMELKLSPLSFCILGFYGFSKEEELDMEEIAVSNGGTVAQAGSPTCTHLVVNEQEIKCVPFDLHGRIHIVKSEWLWASIQMEACADVTMYALDFLKGTSTVESSSRTPTTLSGSNSNKRKRVKENIAQLANEGGEGVNFKRTSLDAVRRSLNSTVINTSSDNVTILADITLSEAQNHSPQRAATSHQSKDGARLTPRQQTIIELFQTESNYVGILHTVLKVFKEAIEKVDQPGGPILNQQDCKAIFGGIPPIYELHHRIRSELNEIITTWRDGFLVGDVFLHHVDDLAKCYPNFVNYFEKTKEIVISCDRTKPRFHAFLMLCQGKPECGRQSLTELLIRPVQRLPSVLLLLKDILKRTEKSHPDHSRLSQAIAALEEVMTHINEDKRKADGHQAMFEIINNIENCPPNLLSAHRSFICKVDVVEVTDELLGKGNPVTLFAFSDSLEICKRRAKLLNGKSPGTAPLKTSHKSYKHLDLLPFSSIKRVIDICESDDCQNVFALISKKIEEKEEKLFAFGMSDASMSKDDFLTLVSKAICTSMCRTDYETLLAAVEAHALNLDTTDLHSSNTLSRAATKFSKQVSRAFSLNKTPREKMKRTMRSMTQVVTSPVHGENRLMTLPPLPFHSPRGSSRSSYVDSEELHSEPDSYSERVDQMSVGTPSLQRRRDTLAQSVDFLAGMLGKRNSGKFGIKLGFGSSPLKCQSSSRLDFASTQSLVMHGQQERASTILRNPSSQSCVKEIHEHCV